MPSAFQTGIVFFVILGILVYFHEFGHFSVAKLLGMKVSEFALGFGPRLVTLGRRKGTEYTIRAIPLGGFVRLPGMEIESPEEFRELEGIEPEEAFIVQPIWKRALVIFAGPFASLLLGYLVFIIAGMAFGWPTDKVLPQVEYVMPGKPAANIGIKHGDIIREINGIRIKDGKQVVDYIHVHPKQKVVLVVERDGRTFTRTTVTESVPVGKGKNEGRLGFIAATQMERTGVIDSIKQGTIGTYAYIVNFAQTLFSKQVTKSVGGIVAIARVTDETIQYGPRYVALELAFLSLTLAFINLIPWPILDGGHLLFLAIERIRGKRLSPKVQISITQIGFAMLIALALFLVYLDISRWVSGTPLQ